MHPSRCVTTRSHDSICIAQNRDLLDVVIPYAENNAVGRFARENFANLVIGISGFFCFATCLRRIEDGQEIVGKCYLVPLWNNRRSVRSARKSIGMLPDYDDNFQSISTEVETSFAELSVCTADVKLVRTGHVTITIDEMPLMDGESEADARILGKLAANQIFYFLKDISHVHQHHDPKQDAITEVTRFDPANPDRWIEKTQNALYREIIRFKRFRNEQSLFRASGVLSYAKSFERSIGNGSSQSRLFNTDELEVSLAVSREELRHKDQRKIAELDSIRNWFFALFGFIISTSFLVRSASTLPTFEVNESLIAVTRYIAESPIPVVFFLVFISVITSFFTHRRDPASVQLVRSVLRWTQGFRMRWYFVANVLFTLVFSFIFYALLLSRLF